MIIVSLDEQGDFENLEGKLLTEPVFIGGVIYDDCGISEDYDNEKKRLQKYFENVCTSVNARYPLDLHFSSFGNKNNGKNVKAVKTKFGETIREFFEDGTFKGVSLDNTPRQGKYYIFATLRGSEGKERLLAQNISEAIREDFASNLYIHMAEYVVERVVFHNPVINDIGKIRLELATRRVILEGPDRPAKMKEYEKLGYVVEQRPAGQSRPGTSEYVLTNPSNYRTAVEREMLSCGKEKILVDRIGVKSIYYKHPKDGMDMLYLADAICSYLSFNRRGDSAASWIKSFDNNANDINPSVRNLIWGYDETDDFFAKAWRNVENGDYYQALDYAYEGINCDSELAEFYKDKWFPLINEAILQRANQNDFSTAVKKVKDSILGNNLDQDKLVFIYEAIETIGTKILFVNKKDEAQLYDLYDTGVSAYTHTGNAEKAELCCERTKKYAEYVATEKFLRTRNKMVVFLCDMLRFDQALNIADENVHYHELLSNMKKNIFADSSYESLNHAIAISQRGQVYAFLNDSRAETDFLKALEIMDIGTPDHIITQSYLLHYYIGSGEFEKYKNVSSDYYGDNSDLLDQFTYLVNEGSKGRNSRFSMKFALYVFVKAAYIFYRDDLQDELINKFKDIRTALFEINEGALNQMNGHPWELIYKYLTLIMLEHGEKDIADVYKDRIKDMVEKSDGIIKSIAEEGMKICEEASIGQKTPVQELTYMYA